MYTVTEKEIGKNLLRLSKSLAGYKQHKEMADKALLQAQEAMKDAQAYQYEAEKELLQVNKIIAELQKEVSEEYWDLLKEEVNNILGVKLPIFECNM